MVSRVPEFVDAQTTERFEVNGFNVVLPAAITSFGGTNRYLSNFYPAKVVLSDDGLTYPSAENAYQAAKLAPGNVRDYFLTCSPFDAKSRGKGQGGEDWKERSLPIMYQVVYDKFTRNPGLGHRLVNTSHQYLVEGNHWGDTFWGQSNANWEGDNYLGRILMAVRHRLIINRKVS